MKDIKNLIKKSSINKLNVDKKVVSILLVFLILVSTLLISIVVSTNSLSALRGFASFQTNWTSARKDVTFQLVNYLRTQDHTFKENMDSSIFLIQEMEHIRIELMKDNTDRELVVELLEKTHSVPDDIGRMITTFENFHEFSEFRETIALWIESDSIIIDMEILGNTAERIINEGKLTPEVQESLISEVIALDDKLTQMQFRLSRSLAIGTDLLNMVIVIVIISLVIISIVIGAIFSLRFLRSVRKWSEEIELSEQKYRSLFDQNPNAVFSVSPVGKLINANKVLEGLIGYTAEEMKNSTFRRFVDKSQVKRVRNYFLLALRGRSLTYETNILKNDGSYLYAEVTNLPIIVDGEITGIYGVINDITHRKEAEQRIKDQLVEKTYLLSEVHDRVKNNLALVSTLVQLQQNEMEKESKSNGFVSTVSRIRSMALVHERLYQNETFSSIRMDEYIQDLIENIQSKGYQKTSKPEVELNTSPVSLSIEQAIPTGLLLNEVLINAFKYGSDSLKPVIIVSLTEHEGEVTIKVADNGPGLPKNFELDRPETLGFKLVSVLLKQLKAGFTINNDNGATFIFRYKIQNPVTSKRSMKQRLAN
jgi:PAS domain S-box-containing protein|tara:strand:+ start:11856 stop:13637 length:1782 start_codon:yes stop_codon:yes gene_type:complete